MNLPQISCIWYVVIANSIKCSDKYKMAAASMEAVTNSDHVGPSGTENSKHNSVIHKHYYCFALKLVTHCYEVPDMANMTKNICT